MTSVTVSAGQVSHGLAAHSGDTITVLNGGTTVASALDGTGLEVVSADGLSQVTGIGSGATERVYITCTS